MTQTLYFEQAWEKTISDQDRKNIHEKFHQLDHSNGVGIQTTYLRHAYNHRGRLLYMVLLHNYTNQACTFSDKTVTIKDDKGHSLMESFTLPVDVPANTSMPWTFIFPETAKVVDANHASLIF